VRKEVQADTHGEQRPEVVMRLNDNLYLAGLSSSLQPPTTVDVQHGEGAGSSSSSSRPRPPPPPPAGPQAFRDCQDDACPWMVMIPRGEFEMGSPSYEAGHHNDEGPVHPVSMGYTFAAAQYPVTRDQWRSFLSATGRSGSNNCYGFNQSTGQFEQKPEFGWLDPGFAQEDNHPVVCVTWNEAQDYVSWLSRRTGHTYRLLTEAEYEYINRAGASSAYLWGSTDDGQCTYANGADAAVKTRFPGLRTASCNDGYVFTSPVGKFQPNRFGLYDTTGNVWSWTQDCYHESYSRAPADGSAWTTRGDCSRRVLRGGSWNNDPGYLRAASRSWGPTAFSHVGLRVARTDL
jgi:formylglycine-generating enzyme